MFVKKFKKKCGVRGCKNISDVFIISRRREMGNTIAMCRECMADALKATEGYVEEVKARKPITSLFPHPEIKEDVTLSSVAEVEEPEPEEVIEDVTEDANIDSVTEDTVTTDFFSFEEPITAPKIPTSHAKKAPPKKSNKTSKKKK